MWSGNRTAAGIGGGRFGPAALFVLAGTWGACAGDMPEPAGAPGGAGAPGAAVDAADDAEAAAKRSRAAEAQARAMAEAARGLAEGAPILWISLDTVRADQLAVYGGRAATPNLDALARTGLVYERAYTHFPETGLSHWAMLTGVLPELHGNVPATGDSAWLGPTAAELAKADGYATGAFIGGVTMTAAATGLDRGFDVYDDQFAVDPRDMKRPAAEVVARAADWIGRQDGKWFALVHLFDAHFPYTPAEPRRYDPDYTGAIDGTDAVLRPYRDGAPLGARDVEHVRALYDAELTELDAALAPLLAAAPDAIVFATADHGESFEHGYLFNHRGSLADGVMHVPWIVRAPGLSPGRVAEPVGLVDALPTLATLAGWGIAPPLHGAPALPPVAPRPELWARTDPWMAGTVAGDAPGPLLTLRTPTWKVTWAADGSARAWDLVADAGENVPVAVPAALADARARYDALLQGRDAWVNAVAARRAVNNEERGMLQALGYLVPDGAGSPPGTPPGGPGTAPSAPPPDAPGANTPSITTPGAPGANTPSITTPGPRGPPPGAPGGPGGPPIPPGQTAPDPEAGRR